MTAPDVISRYLGKTIHIFLVASEIVTMKTPGATITTKLHFASISVLVNKHITRATYSHIIQGNAIGQHAR